MAKPNRLEEIKRQRGKPLEEIIPTLVNQLGSAKAAAREIGVTDSTIVTWLRNAGYRRVTQYIKDEDSSARWKEYNKRKSSCG